MGTIAFIDLPVIKKEAIAAGQPGVLPGKRQQSRDETADNGLAEAASDANYRDAAIFPIREKVLDDSAADRTRLTGGWLDVHQQSPVSYTHLDVYKRQGVR